MSVDVSSSRAPIRAAGVVIACQKPVADAVVPAESRADSPVDESVGIAFDAQDADSRVDA